NPDNSHATASLTVMPVRADLSVYKYQNYQNSEGVPGGQLEYYISYTNYGYQSTADAHHVRITQTLPTNSTFVGAFTSDPTTQVRTNVTPTLIIGNQVVFSLGTVPLFGQGSLLIDVQLNGSTHVGEDVVNRV